MAKEFQISDSTNSIKEKDTSKPAMVEKIDTSEEKKKIKKEKPKKKERVAKEKRKPFENFRWSKLLFPTVATFTLIGIGLFYYFGIFKFKPTPLYEVLSLDEMYVASFPLPVLSRSLPLLSKPNEPRTEVSPLNGLLFSKGEMEEMMKRRPVAVMTNNHVQARPLSGLNSADIVIEANAESGITRHLVIYWSKAPEKIGPIRSLRQSYLEWASEYDPLLIYDGCAQTDNPKTNACGNVHSYNTKIIATLGAWRSNEGGRVAPHNEFSSVKNSWNYAKEKGWDSFPSNLGTWEFKRDADINDRGSKTVVKTIFHTRLSNGGMYDAMWKYDSSTNIYLREIGGKADIDAETNTQINAKVLIIQEVNVQPSGDDAGRLITTTTGEGKATILQDGKIVNGKWKKDSRTDRTKYYDSSGKLIKLNRGRIWISMIPHSDGKFDIIEQ